MVDEAQRDIRLHAGIRERLAQHQAHRHVILVLLVFPTRTDAKLPLVPVNLGLRAERALTHGMRQRREAVETRADALSRTRLAVIIGVGVHHANRLHGRGRDATSLKIPNCL